MFLSVYGVPDGPPGIPRLSVVCHYCVPPTTTTANPYSTVPRRSPFPVVFPPFALTPVGLACSSFNGPECDFFVKRHSERGSPPLWPLLSSTPKPSLCPVPSLSLLPPPTLPHPVRLREPRLLGTPLLAACEPGPIPSSPSLPVLPWTLTIPPAPPPLSPRSSVSIRGCAGPPSPGPS